MKMFAGNIEKQLKWLHGLEMFGINLGLKNVEHLLRRMGNPQNGYRTIHVAGSDGKGSTCAILASVLRAAGYRVGVYSSPDILRFNERISIDGEDISDDDLAYYLSRVRHFVDDMKESEIYCTFFEVTTAMAFDYFGRKGVDIAVIEVGMGGRLDATNVITPEVSVINNISLEHTNYLGDTLEAIAFEKAGIVKGGVPCVTINSSPASDVISKVCGERNAPLVRIDPSEILSTSVDRDGTSFTYKGAGYRVSIPGTKSASNAVLALEALACLPEFGEKVAPHVAEGLGNVKWPCRLQNLGNGFILDVTHTAAGSLALRDDIGSIYGKVTVVLGVLDDKDLESICGNLSCIASRLIVTAPQCQRARPAGDAFEVVRKVHPDAELVEGVGNALEAARKTPGNVLVTGSFYMVSEALGWMGRTSL